MLCPLRADASPDINRATLDAFLANKVLILGALLLLHDAVVGCGARMIGAWLQQLAGEPRTLEEQGFRA